MAAYTATQSGNLSASATWGGAGVPTAADTVNTGAFTVALDVDVTGLAGITVASGGKFTWGTNGKSLLAFAGNIVIGNGALEGGPDGVLEFDNVGRVVQMSTAFGQPNTLLSTTGTSAAHPFTIRSTTGGTNARIKHNNQDVAKFTVAYVNVLRIGDTTNDCLQLFYNARTGVVSTFDHCTFDTCGLVNVAEAPVAASGWSFSDVKFTNTNAKTNGASSLVNPLVLRGAASPTATRLVQRCSFDKPPVVLGVGTTYIDCYFAQEWDASGGATAAWAAMTRPVVRKSNSASSPVCFGPVTDLVTVGDLGNAPTDTGTATAATSTTLTDSGKSWTASAFASNASNKNFHVEILTGTGAGQVRLVTANTATQLTTSPAWTITPDATSTYEIVAGLVNPHYLNPLSTLSAVAVTGAIFENTGTDANGDCFEGSTAPAGSSITTSLVLPNAAGLSSGSLTNFNNASAGVIVEHNTACITGCPGVLAGDFAASNAGTYASVKGNAFFNARAGLALSYKTYDATNPSSGGAVVVTAANADYNCGQNALAGNYSGNGYDTNTGGTQAGAHDVSGDPQFVDASRNFVSWATSQGATGNRRAKIAFGFAILAADPTLGASYRTYVRAGFAPQNAALHNAAHDGTDIGAVAYSALVTGGPFPHFLRRCLHGGMMPLAGNTN